MAKNKKTMETEEELDRSPGLGMCFGEINTELVAGLTEWILVENLSDNPPHVLTMLINSPGGSLSDAFALIEIMNGSRIPIYTVGLGEIASAGLLIFMSGVKGGRIITPTCSIMSHHFSAGTAGTYHDLVAINKEFSFTNQRIINQYVKCTGLTATQVKEKLLPQNDVFLTPQQALELNLADEIRGLYDTPITE